MTDSDRIAQLERRLETTEVLLVATVGLLEHTLNMLQISFEGTPHSAVFDAIADRRKALKAKLRPAV